MQIVFKMFKLLTQDLEVSMVNKWWNKLLAKKHFIMSVFLQSFSTLHINPLYDAKFDGQTFEKLTQWTFPHSSKVSLEHAKLSQIEFLDSFWSLDSHLIQNF